MKTILFLIPLSVALADPICLQQATNQELLNEVSRRMTGVSPTQEAIASYDCDIYSKLTITLIASGSVRTTEVDVGENSTCKALASELAQYRGRIKNPSFAAACDLYGTLYKFYMSAQGALDLVNKNELASLTQCRSQATTINTTNPR